MKSVEVIRTTKIPAEIIWDEMKHFDRVLRWVPGGDKSTISVRQMFYYFRQRLAICCGR